jgi:hypothetical protein
VVKEIKMGVATYKNKGDLSVICLFCALHIKTIHRHQTGFFMVIFESVKGPVKAVTLCGRVMLWWYEG